MKKAMMVLFLIICFGAAPVLAQTKSATDKKIDEIMQRLEVLSRQNEAILQKNRELEKKNDSLSQEVKSLRENNTQEVETLRRDVEPILSKVETKTLLDKVNLGVELRTRCDWFDYKGDQTAYRFRGLRFEQYTKHINESVRAIFSDRFRLNMKVELSDNLQFHGRMVAFYNWSDETKSKFPATNLFNEGRYPDDTEVKLERAYVDYFFTPHPKLPMAFSFGRLPYTDGMPTDLRENTPRKSTYPALAFDCLGSGLALSANLQPLTGLPDSALRFVYLRKVDDNDLYRYREDTVNVKSLDMYVGQFETGLPYAWSKDILYMVNLMYFPRMPDEAFKNLSPRILWPADLPDSLGSIWKLTFFVESRQFLGSWFDWFAGFSYMHTNTSGDAATYSILFPGSPLKTSMGLINDDGSPSRKATAFHVGTRINFPLHALNDPKLGIEYNHGSRYWWGLNGAPEDPLTKLDVRGDCWDFYWLQPIDKHFSARMGLTMLNRDYGGMWFVGGAPHVDETITNYYLLFDAVF